MQEPAGSGLARQEPQERVCPADLSRSGRQAACETQAKPPLLVLRGAAGLWEQSSGAGLNEEDQCDQQQDLGKHSSDVWFEQVVHNSHGESANQRSPQIADTAEYHHYK